MKESELRKIIRKETKNIVSENFTIPQFLIESKKLERALHRFHITMTAKQIEDWSNDKKILSTKIIKEMKHLDTFLTSILKNIEKYPQKKIAGEQ